MAYLLDTNACIQILNSPNSPVAQKTLLIPSRNSIFAASFGFFFDRTIFIQAVAARDGRNHSS